MVKPKARHVSKTLLELDVQAVQVGCPEHQGNQREVAAFDVKANWRPHGEGHCHVNPLMARC
jgi:hypothetical protein